MDEQEVYYEEPKNAIQIILGPDRYVVSSMLTANTSDKTFDKLLKRIMYAERYIRAAKDIQSEDFEVVLDIDGEDEGETLG
jgi:hypothetical protein